MSVCCPKHSQKKEREREELCLRYRYVNLLGFKRERERERVCVVGAKRRASNRLRVCAMKRPTIEHQYQLERAREREKLKLSRM